MHDRGELVGSQAMRGRFESSLKERQGVALSSDSHILNMSREIALYGDFARWSSGEVFSEVSWHVG
jgi:hypothetical protein